MPATTATFAALTSEQIHSLIVTPVRNLSVAMQVCEQIDITETSIRIPRITNDGSAAWVVEGGAIPMSEASADEIDATPAKVAGLRTISRELAADSSPAAQQVVGDGLVAAIADSLDAAFFGPTLASPAPAGLRSIGATANQVVLPKTILNVDAMQAAIAHGKDVGAPVTAFVTSPALALELATIKDSSGSQRGLLQPDPTVPDRNVVGGVPILTSKYVEAGDIWAIARSRTFAVIRKQAEVEASEHFLWNTDQISVRGIMRATFAFTDPASISRIRRATS